MQFWRLLSLQKSPPWDFFDKLRAEAFTPLPLLCELIFYQLIVRDNAVNVDTTREYIC